MLCLAIVLPMEQAGGLPAGTWVAEGNRIPTPGIAIAYLTFTSNLLGIDGYVNNVFWSLPIEFQFYFLFPLFAILLRRSPLWLAAVAVGLFGLGRGLHWPGQTAELAWIFAGGMMAGWFFARRRRNLPAAPVLVVAGAALLAGGVLENLPTWLEHGLPGPLHLYFGTVAVVLVLAAAHLNLYHLRLHPVIRSLITQGDISYSIYLFHTPFILLAYALLEHWRPEGMVALALVYGLVLPGTWAAAHLVHRVIERPAIALGRRLSAPNREEASPLIARRARSVPARP
ncbi:MAG TPA: acyltransferase [Acetobacteraceae bacterium]